ncbi:MAG: aromatic ring-hydroxylating dioxygenase subunit alpha [Pigmentiphaga sp.]|uniref:Rieske 2Fe-2S domain-containing protein n=1 Tax=Pigmentiphaga daeguensis TaxID=414049 RepID=A0ABN1D3Q5_9BURK
MNHSVPYRQAPAADQLFDGDRVHRDVYLDPQVFDLECERLFARGWVYVGHASQVPNPGDFITTWIARLPVIMIRQPDGQIQVLPNRCAHKGAMIVSQPSGNAGKLLRCPYHAWTYRLDGSTLGIPLRAGYEGSRLLQTEAAQGLERLASETYRGFVFARAAPEGLPFREYFGDMLSVLDNLADRSPQGELRIAGGSLRSVIACNWKMYIENVVDAVHPISTHESAWQTARDAAQGWPDETPLPTELAQLLPFGSGHDFYRDAGARVHAHGHCILGIRGSIHSGYAPVPGYEESLQAALGEARTKAVLAFTPQNSVLFPTLALKSSPQTLRIVRPLDVGRTLVEIFALEPVGAPPELLRRTLTYNRLVFSPASIVAHDDIHVFETMQRALVHRGNPWVSLHREHHGEERELPAEASGNSELPMRNFYRAWSALMATD